MDLARWTSVAGAFELRFFHPATQSLRRPGRAQPGAQTQLTDCQRAVRSNHLQICIEASRQLSLGDQPLAMRAAASGLRKAGTSLVCGLLVPIMMPKAYGFTGLSGSYTLTYGYNLAGALTSLAEPSQSVVCPTILLTSNT